MCHGFNLVSVVTMELPAVGWGGGGGRLSDFDVCRATTYATRTVESSYPLRVCCFYKSIDAFPAVWLETNITQLYNFAQCVKMAVVHSK